MDFFAPFTTGLCSLRCQLIQQTKIYLKLPHILWVEEHFSNDRKRSIAIQEAFLGKFHLSVGLKMMDIIFRAVESGMRTASLFVGYYYVIFVLMASEIKQGF